MFSPGRDCGWENGEDFVRRLHLGRRLVGEGRSEEADRGVLHLCLFLFLHRSCHSAPEIVLTQCVTR